MSVAAPHAEGIGPNAIIRAAEALVEMEGFATAAQVFQAAGIERYLTVPPTDMVPENDVTALHRAMHATLGPARARSAARDAGRRTADYLLANRIPGPVQRLLRILPAAVAAPILLSAIRRNAWTFVGTGDFSATPGNPIRIIIAHCPLCRGAATGEPSCDFYAATFEGLFARLVHPRAAVTETHCVAAGNHCCRFELRWPR